MATRTSITRLDKSRFDRTIEGYILTKVHPTRVGVFAYFDEETGKIVKEFRPPEEVFKPAHLTSLHHKIVTDDHPPVMLDSKNTPKYNCGHMTGDHVKADDGIHTESELVITNSKLCEKVDDGKEQVSLGYTCDIDDTPGEYMGEKYDRIQRNMKCNHLAIVERGRAKTAALRGDSEAAQATGKTRSVARYDAYEIEPDDEEEEKPKAPDLPLPAKKVPAAKKDKEEKVWRKYRMPDYRHDDDVYDVSEKAFEMLKHRDKADKKERADHEKALNKIEQEAEKARTDAAEKDKKIGELQAKIDQYEEEIEALKDIDTRVDAREDLKAKAQAVLGKTYDIKGKTDEQIKMDVLQKACPGAVDKLNKMDAAQKPTYLNARFDGVTENVKAFAPKAGERVLKAVDKIDAEDYFDAEDNEYFDDELNEKKGA